MFESVYVVPIGNHLYKGVMIGSLPIGLISAGNRSNLAAEVVQIVDLLRLQASGLKSFASLLILDPHLVQNIERTVDEVSLKALGNMSVADLCQAYLESRRTLVESMTDAPFCPQCAHITVRHGDGFKCLNCDAFISSPLN